MITIDPYSRAPIYEQVVRKICECIMAGDLKNGDQLPSVRQLARDIGVNPNTVQKAYAELERQKIIYTQTGKGNFVCEEAAVAKQVRGRLLCAVSEAALAAKNNAIPLDGVVQAVRQVYDGEVGE